MRMPNPVLVGITENSVDYDFRDLDAQEKLLTKAEQDGSYSNMTVGNAEQLVSTVGITDKVPYNFRTSGGSADIGDREEDTVVGGTVAWNQLVPANKKTLSWSAGGSSDEPFYTGPVYMYHKYLILSDRSATLTSNERNTYHFTVGGTQYYENSQTNANLNKGSYAFVFNAPTTDATATFRIWVHTPDVAVTYDNIQTIDLTQMFGSTIADYIYSLETATAGAGVAYFRKLFPKPYYAYNAGELMSVQTSAHEMTGFNQFDLSEFARLYPNECSMSGDTLNCGAASVLYTTGVPVNIPADIAGGYYTVELKCGTATNVRVKFIYEDGTISEGSAASTTTEFVKKYGALYNKRIVAICFNWSQSGSFSIRNFCINLHWDGERDGEYEPYVKYSYPLDSSLTLRGIPKLDASNSLYYDGDVYKPDGTVTRKYGVITFDGSDDEGWGQYGGNRFYCGSVVPNFISPSTSVIANLFTNRGFFIVAKQTMPANNNGSKYISAYDANANRFIINLALDTLTEVKAWLAANPLIVLYELAEPTTEEAEPFQTPQIVDDFGTEEYVDIRDVAVPVGHETVYRNNLRAKLEMAPESPDGNGDYIVRQTNGQNEYVPLVIPTELPANPSESGNYILKATVSDGTTVLSWEVQA